MPISSLLPPYTGLGLVSGDVVAGAIISHTRAARSSFRELTTEESAMRPEVHTIRCTHMHTHKMYSLYVHTHFTDDDNEEVLSR